MERKVRFIGAAMGWGASNSGCEDGAVAVQKTSLIDDLRAMGIRARWENTLFAHSSARSKPKTLAQTLPLVHEFDERLSDQVRHVMRHDAFPVVIGGDHSIAVATWSGTVKALEAQQRFGLIWFDAHMDAHTPETAKEGKWGGLYHGQPLACLLGAGETELLNIAGDSIKLSPEHVCLIGIRSFEPGEQKFLEELGVRIYYMEEVHRRGFETVFKEAQQIVQKGIAGYGLTIDMDGFDGADAPGVGTVESDGVLARDVLPVLKGLAQDSRFKALEITEFNPHRDVEDKTKKLVQNIIKTIFIKDV